MADTQGPPVSGGSKIFGVRKQDPGYRQGEAHTRESKRRGYEDKYEDDALGEELGNNARIWRVMLDEGLADDAVMLQRFRDHLDVDLVFAGLFSAVLTTFVAQTSQTSSDASDATISLLVELIAIQRAWANNNRVNDVGSYSLAPPSPSPSPWINRCWFLSLVFSLLAAFSAVVVRQWLQEYESDITGHPKRRALVRHYRRVGLRNYKIHSIVPILPMLLHVSLLLFFVGLALYVRQSDRSMSNVIIALTVMIYTIYLATNLMPIIRPQCPYRSPLSTAGYWARSVVAPLYALLCNKLSRHLPYPSRSQPAPRRRASNQAGTQGRQLHNVLGANVDNAALERHRLDILRTPSDHEWDTVVQQSDDLIPDSLDWAIHASSDLSVAPLVVQASSCIRHAPHAPLSNLPYEKLLHGRILPWFINTTNTRGEVFDWAPGRENELQRMACALLLVLQNDDTEGPHLEGIDVCLSRVFQGLMSAITSIHAAELDVATLCATTLALGDRLDDFDPNSSLLKNGACLTSIAAAYSPRVNRRLRAGLHLHPVVWHHMTRYLRYLADTASIVPCPPLAIALWRSLLVDASPIQHDHNSSGEHSPWSSRLTLHEWLSSEAITYRSGSIQIALYGLLCPASCSAHSHSTDLPYAGPTIFQWLHMACHGIDSYEQEVGAVDNVAFDNDLSFFIDHFLRTLCGFLEYGSIDFALTVIGYSATSAFFRSTFLCRPRLPLVEFVKADVALHPTHAMSLFWFLVELASAIYATDHSDKESAVCDVFRALDRHATKYRPETASTLSYDEVSVERLRPAARAIMNYPQLAHLDLLDVIAETMALHLNKATDAARSERFAEDFVMCIHLDVVCAARAASAKYFDIESSDAMHGLHSALLKVKTEYQDIWKSEIELAFQQEYTPLSLALALNSPRGLDVLAELVDGMHAIVQGPTVEAEVPYETRWQRSNDWYRRFAANPGKYTRVKKADRAWRLPISELVTLEEYHKRTVEAVTRDDAEDVQGDSQEEDADEGAQHEGLRDRDNGAEEEAGEGDGGEGVEQGGIQAFAQAISGRIAAGWKRFYPYMAFRRAGPHHEQDTELPAHQGSDGLDGIA